MWVIRRAGTKEKVWQVGYYIVSSHETVWYNYMECATQTEASERCHYLNGGN
jgi:hypothetical protein